MDEPAVNVEVVAPALAVADETEELATFLSDRLIISEEKAEKICNEVEQCRNQLENLSSRIPTVEPESPLLARLLEEVATVKSDLQSLKSFLDTKLSSPLLSESTPEPVLVEVVEPMPAVEEVLPALPNPEESIVEPSEEEPTPEPRRRRHRVI